MTHFRDIVYNTKLSSQFELTLQDCYYKYYDADAVPLVDPGQRRGIAGRRAAVSAR